MEWNKAAESRTREDLWAGQEHNPLLAAAIAALLVDHQRRADQQDGPKDSPGSQTHWRLLARWEQLRG